MTDLLIILALILLNGVFAMSELALASARRLRLEESANAGSEGARVALALGADPSAFLSTVQVGITLISIFNGAFGEASLVARLTPLLSGIAPAAYARPVALAIVIVGITFVSIVLGELVPKRIAMQHPETVAALVARPLCTLSRLMAPFVKVLSLTTELIIKLLELQQPRDEAPTQQEISGMLKEGTDAGVLDKTEYDIVRRAMRLDAQRLSALMTPRIDMQFIDLDDDPARNLAMIAASPYSRFPVFRGERSHVLGIVDAGDLLQQVINQGARVKVDLEAVAKAPLFVPNTISAINLLGQFRAHGAELALVVDEHGQLQGMVTLVDLMGALVGGVPGVESHETDAAARRWQLADGWRDQPGMAARAAWHRRRIAGRGGRRLPDAGRPGAAPARPHAARGRQFRMQRLSLRSGRHGPQPDRPGTCFSHLARGAVQYVREAGQTVAGWRVMRRREEGPDSIEQDDG